MEEGVRALSYAFDSKGVTTTGNAARLHESSLRIFEQLFNNRFRFLAVHHLSVDHVMIGVVSAEHAASAKMGRIFVRFPITLTRLGMNEDRTTFRIGMAGRDRGKRKENDAFAGLGPLEAMAAGE